MSVARMVVDRVEDRTAEMANTPPWEIVRMLEETPGKNDKANILSFIPNNHEFWEGAALARDKLVTFGVKKLPDLPEGEEHAIIAGTITWRVFRALCDELSNRTLTGNAAKVRIQEIAMNSTADQWNNWYARILRKSLQCGADKTINDAAPPEWKVNAFGVQLAADGNKALPHHWPRDAYVEAKYDGSRAAFFVRSDGPVKSFSRNGKEWMNFDQVGARLALLREHPLVQEWGGCVLDGEIMSKTFQELMKQVRRKSNIDISDLYFMTFDVVPIKIFDNHGKSAPLHERRGHLEELVSWLNREHPSNITTIEVSEILKDVDPQGADKATVESFYLDQLDLKLEGIITKDKNAPYVFKRSNAWIKTKPNDSVDLRIVGVYPGDPDKRFAHTLGGFHCEGVDDDVLIKVDVGGGLTEKMRDDAWANPDEYIGRMIEVVYDGEGKGKKSIAENADHYSLRFPRFKRFREDKE